MSLVHASEVLSQLKSRRAKRAFTQLQALCPIWHANSSAAPTPSIGTFKGQRPKSYSFSNLSILGEKQIFKTADESVLTYAKRLTAHGRPGNRIAVNFDTPTEQTFAWNAQKRCFLLEA